MRLSSLLACLAFFAAWVAPARADLGTDYAALTAGVQGQSAPTSGSPAGVAMFGNAAFPVLLGTIAPVQAVMAVGRHGDSYDPAAARAVAWSHTSFFDTVGGVRTTLFSNAVLWASRQAAPAGTIAVVVSNTTVGTFLTTAGYTVRSASASITAANLSGAHVLVLGGNTDYSSAVLTLIANFTAGGGGVVMSGTPWAASDGAFADSIAVLDPFGLVMNKSTPDDTSWTIAAAAHPVIHTALPAADALIADKEGTAPLTAADRTIAANAIFQVTSVRIDIPALAAKLDVLGDAAHYGRIAPTLAAPINPTQKPVEKMLARYQSQTFDLLTPAQLFVHPCAADFPGAVAAGAATVSRTVAVNGNTPVDFYMNHGERPTRIETGLYAAPGATITVTIPAGLTAQGLQLHIAPNGSEDTTFNYTNNWTFFPKLWRRVALTQSATQTGHVLGGLLTILVPEGKALGTFNVTIDGAVEAPAFVLGQTTDAQWNAGIKNNPAPYGYIQNSKLTIYLPKTQLAAMDNPTAVTSYWLQVMDIADEYYGYTTYRKRAETYATARYVSAGAAYANYPIEAGWGTTSDLLLNDARINGDWGSYHELGHNYQNIFDSAFVIAIGAEVDVNLFPGMIYTLLHDRTPWDGAHSTYNAANRVVARAEFLALPAAEQTWQGAHDTSPMAYDFYFNLAEAFGWQLYKTALGRLMRYLQSPSAATDAALHALSTSDPNFKRNRFYLLFCDAAGRNLDTYFQRYGLGKVGAGAEITQSVKDAIAAKGYPVWSDTTPIDALSTPPALNVSESSAPGTELYQFIATDAEEPGQVLDYSITTGNIGNAFSIDRRTGRLRVQKVDAETLGSYSLTVQVQDCGVPRFATTKTFTVNVTNVAEPPQVEGRLFTATSAMANGTVLGNLSVGVEQGRTLSSLAIVAGNDGHFSLNPTSGAISVSNAATLPNPGVVVLTVRAIDSTGATGFGTATILCNRATGILEERWPGTTITGPPAVTSTFTTITSAQNVANTYIRRVSGWLVPATSGVYVFWIAADDTATLALSTDETAANKQVIAAVESATSFQQWNKSATQMSVARFLQAGRAYYLEAVQRENSGSDHVSVAWQGPNIAQQVIPGAVLIPADATTNFPPSAPAPSVTIPSPEEGAYLFVPGTHTIAATISDNTLTITKVQFLDGATLLGEDADAPFSFAWVNPAVGPHTLRARVVHTAGTVDSNGRSVTVAAAGAPICFVTSPQAAEAALPPGVGLILEATVADDTPATLTTAWSRVSGPGTVSFGNNSAPNTTATFSQSGTYVLRLTASDGTQQTLDEVTIDASVAAAPQLLDAEVNSPRAGSGTNDGTTFTVSGAGSDIYGSSDQFHFYYVAVAGDFDFRARLTAKTVSAIGAHTALMARESLVANSIHASVSQESSGSTYLMQRSTSGGSTTINIGGAVSNTPPTWMRLVRAGSSFTGYISEDGIAWTQRGPVTSTLPATVLVGFAVSNSESTAAPALNVATFDNVSGIGGGDVGPAVSTGVDQSITTLQTTLAGTVSDEGLPAPPGATSTVWQKVSGPGTATFFNATLPATTVAFSRAGTYTLRLIADDGATKTFDDITLTTPAAFTLWQNAQFGASAGDPAIAGPDADPNKNGWKNLLEYALGTDPLAAGIPSMSAAQLGNRLTLLFTRNPAATDLTQTVQGADHLAGPWLDLARSVNGGFFLPLLGGVTVQDSGTGPVEVRDLYFINDPAHPRRFLRLHVAGP